MNVSRYNYRLFTMTFSYYKKLIFLSALVCLLLSNGAYIFGIDHDTKSTPIAGSELQIKKLVSEAKECLAKQNDPGIADSLLNAAISLAEMTYRNDLILSTYNEYIECMDVGHFDKSRMEYASKSVILCNTEKESVIVWKTYNNAAEVYLSMYSYDQALAFSYKSLSVADYLKNDTLKAKSYLSIGNSLWKINNIIEAFRNYLLALNIAENAGNDDLLNTCYGELSEFYNKSKNYEKAIEYKLRQGDLIRKKTPYDSLKIMYNQFELEYINVTLHYKPNERNIDLLLKYAQQHKDFRLKQYILTIYRYYLINNNKLDKLKELYVDKFPADLKSLMNSDSCMYFRVMALICENQGKVDSAFYYFDKAALSINLLPNMELKSTFYQRYGQFLVRQNNKQKGIEMFLTSYQLATQGHNMELAISSSKQLESVYESMNDYKNAWHFARQTLVLSDSLNQISKKDQLLLLDIDNAARQRELTLQREQEAIRLRHNIQYTAITIIIVVIFLILILLGSLRVPRWLIELLGFISFILLFEFIVLITDHIIEDITHGEPWKVLGIKIILIGILMPLHHLVEKRMIRYLLNRKLIHISKDSVKRFLKEMFRPDREP